MAHPFGAACNAGGRRAKSFYLNVQIEVACADLIQPQDWIDGDMGHTDVLHTSMTSTWGRHHKAVSQRYYRIRRALQR